MNKQLNSKYLALKNIIKKRERAAIAFSGGVDSTLLLKVAFDLLGKNVTAFTVRSNIFPQRELKEAKVTAATIGAEHIIIDFKGTESEIFTKNLPDRCFFCKTEIFSKIIKEAEKKNITTLFDGGNIDDLSDFRPGKKGIILLGIDSPLEMAGLNKKDIRTLSKELGLSTWNKPSAACLASRFPYYTKITEQGLQQVEKSENFLYELGLREIRVRHHGSLARIEAGAEELRLLKKNQSLNAEIVQYLKSTGYKYVCIDMEKFRSGRMNEELGAAELKLM